MVRDMTKGKPLNLILAFCIPMIFGNLFQQFYSMVDTIVVGRYVGVNALAAVGSVGSVYFLVIGFATGICSGFSIPVAQFFGAGDYVKMRKYVANTAYLCIIFGAALTAATMLLTKDLLKLMNTPSDIFDDAYRYIIIVFAGIPVTIFYNILASISRALGDSKTPLKYLTIASGLNIVLDLVFVLVFKLGVSGVAYATVISQLISGILCFIYMKKNLDILYFDRQEVRWDTACVSRLLKVGVPMALQFSITAVGSIILQRAVNSLGSGIVAATTAGSKVQMLVTQPMETLGVTMATYGGQNLGAQRVDRIVKGVKQSFIVQMIYCAAAALIIFFFGVYICYLFVDSSETSILQNASHFLRTQCIFYPTLGVLFIFRNLLQGLSFSFLPMLAGVTELIARSVVAFGFVGKFGFNAVCYASPIAWIAAAVLLTVVYFFKIKYLKKRYPYN
ncbi:MATE family efflux transporter [Hominimerdicola sp. 21CYCFAH17_S]